MDSWFLVYWSLGKVQKTYLTWNFVPGALLVVDSCNGFRAAYIAILALQIDLTSISKIVAIVETWKSLSSTDIAIIAMKYVQIAVRPCCGEVDEPYRALCIRWKILMWISGNFQWRMQPRFAEKGTAVTTSSFVRGLTSPFDIPHGISEIFDWMVHFRKIRWFPELFPGNFRTICSRFEIFGIFAWLESAPILPTKHFT